MNNKVLSKLAPEKILSGLLAIIHRDGGHHEGEVGTVQAAEDAAEIYYKLANIRDRVGDFVRGRDQALTATETMILIENVHMAWKELSEDERR